MGFASIAVVAALRSRLAREDGSLFVELAVGTLVASVGVLGLVSSMTSSMASIGQSRQRSAAVAMAQEHLERVHSLPYERIALSEAPLHNADPDHPDNDVTADNISYRVSADVTEPLTVDAVSGALERMHDRTLGRTELSINQYVTWVDDQTIAGTQNYKRVSVVAAWKHPMKGGARSNVVQSTFVTDGTISLPESTPPPALSGTSVATPTPPPAPLCEGDTTAPTGSIEVISGSGSAQDFTNSTSIQIRLDETDACSHVFAELSNDGIGFTEVATHLDSQPVTVSWTVAGGNGTKTVYARFRDAAGNVSTTLSAQIVLDETPPTVPGNLRASQCSVSGSNRTITLVWDASTDENLIGYRVFRSIESGRFIDIATTASASMTDSERKSYGSVRYLVRAYDKAGSESADSNVLSFSRNAC